jgi:hypothetical protein
MTTLLVALLIAIVVWIVLEHYRRARLRREQAVRDAQASLARLLGEVSYCKGFIAGRASKRP